jgi:hypothetical protein
MALSDEQSSLLRYGVNCGRSADPCEPSYVCNSCKLVRSSMSTILYPNRTFVGKGSSLGWVFTWLVSSLARKYGGNTLAYINNRCKKAFWPGSCTLKTFHRKLVCLSKPVKVTGDRKDTSLP